MGARTWPLDHDDRIRTSSPTGALPDRDRKCSMLTEPVYFKMSQSPLSPWMQQEEKNRALSAQQNTAALRRSERRSVALPIANTQSAADPGNKLTWQPRPLLLPCEFRFPSPSRHLSFFLKLNDPFHLLSISRHRTVNCNIQFHEVLCFSFRPSDLDTPSVSRSIALGK